MCRREARFEARQLNCEPPLISIATCPLNLLKIAQLPASVPDGSGGFIVKPATW